MSELNFSTDKEVFFSLYHLPARLSAQQTAWYLGIAESRISLLMHEKILCPLGNPAQNGPKWFALVDLDALRQNPNAMAKIHATIKREDHAKNNPH